MVGVEGSLPLSEHAPAITAGVEGSCYIWDWGAFRLGPGAGLLVGEFRATNPYPTYSQARLKLSLFARGEYKWGSGAVKPFVLLDAGGQMTLAPGYSSKEDPTWWDKAGYALTNTTSFFFTPAVGMDLSRHFYLSAGVWCQQQRYREGLVPSRLTASAILKLGVRF